MHKAGLKSGVLMLLWVVFAGTGCEREPEAPQIVRTEVAVRHYFSLTGPFSKTMNGLAEDFNHSNVKYSLRPTPLEHESFKTIIRDDLQTGRTADVYSYWAGARVQSIVDKLAPIDDVLPLADMDKRFGSAIVKSACTYNGRVYLLPLTQQYVGFFYNKKVFADNGLKPPQTWPEFLQLGKALKARGVTPIALGSKAKWPAQFWFDYLLLRTAPLEYRQKLMAGEASFTDPQVLRVFSLWRDLLKAGFFNARPNTLEFDSDAATQVLRGEAAMTLMGTWLMGYFHSPELDWHEGADYGFFPFPEIDPQIPRVALGPIDGFVIPAAAKNPEGAKAVLAYFSSAVSQVTISRAAGSIAPNLSVEDRHYSPMQREIRAEIGRSNAWAFNYDLATPPARADIGLNLFSEFLESPDDYKRLLSNTQERMARISVVPQVR
ncbi:extracellular solute-binding protein [Uliginosibacterium flavum]|uniref:Extracellular solute-binding protein n=1 Tax=Uliginosibacterium flavum TaxID=1396831 RepID=A0ABV2TIG9_9RHOO